MAFRCARGFSPDRLAAILTRAPDGAGTTMTEVRKGQALEMMSREQFRARFEHDYVDPAFDAERDALRRIEEIAWRAYSAGNKSPRTRKAGPGFADPGYELSIEWLQARERIALAAQRQRDPASPSRVLLVVGSARNDGTCPGEMSKTFRLAGMAREEIERADMQCDVLDLSEQVSQYERRIHPCKGCVSTAMPLCHWPCSCYPNHALGQTNDWMNEIYERWSAAHGVIVLTPTYWYQAPAALKLMIDRLVCADGGNPDPTTTHGKTPAEAKALELAGWPYPKHLAGRAYGVFVHGDVDGIEALRRSLCDWLDWMGLVSAGHHAETNRYIGYWAPYATSHDALDEDGAVQEELRNVARAVIAAVRRLRAGTLHRPDEGLSAPRPK